MTNTYWPDYELANIEIRRLRRIIRELAYRLTITCGDDTVVCNICTWAGMDKGQIQEVLEEHQDRRRKDEINAR